MAEKKTYADILGQGKIGKYTESTGGGTPLDKGEKLKDHPEAHRVQQPRDEEGKFTYNSVNKKPLKYGPSRGTTIPPMLRGVTLAYAAKNNSVIVDNEGKTWLSKLDMNASELIDRFKQFDKEKGFKELSEEISRKRGRKSRNEQEKIAQNIVGSVFQKAQTISKGAAYAGYKNFQNIVTQFSNKDDFLKKFNQSVSRDTAIEKDTRRYKIQPGANPFKRVEPVKPTSEKKVEPIKPTPEKKVEPTQPAPTKAEPTQPAPEKKEGGSNLYKNEDGSFNTEKIKSDDMAFRKANRDDFLGVIQAIRSKNSNINQQELNNKMNDIMAGIKSGKYKNFDDVKKSI